MIVNNVKITKFGIILTYQNIATKIWIDVGMGKIYEY